MREIAELLGIAPFSSPNHDLKGVDEANLTINNEELNEMAQHADAALQSILQLQIKSTQFELEISQLSSTMAALKTRSQSLHHQLATRDETLRVLDPLLSQLVPSSFDVGLICDGEIGPEWYAALDRVRAPLPSLESFGLTPNFSEERLANGDSNVKLLNSARRLRKVLISRALERAKTLFVAKLRTLRRPGINAQIVQSELLEAAPALRLLMAQTPRLAALLGRAYRNTMKWYYTMLLGKYGRWLSRQPLIDAEQPSLLGTAVTKTAPFFPTKMGASPAQSWDAFSIGARPTVLAGISAKVPNFVAATGDSGGALPMATLPPSKAPQYSLEVLVRSLLLVLADSVGMEAQVSPLIAVALPTAEMFDSVLSAYANVLQTWFYQCRNDVFGLLLAVRLAEAEPVEQWLADWLQTNVINRCWPYITTICHQQAQSIEQAALRASTKTAERCQGPHLLTQLVSSYFSGILQLCPAEPEPALRQGLHEIVQAYELFVSRLASGNETVLHTNYFVMAALLGDIRGDLATGIAKHFQLLVDAHAAK